MIAPLPPRVPKARVQLAEGQTLCDHCVAKCCRYFALAIDTPSTPEDYDILRWYLVHQRAAIFTEQDVWYLLVYNVCQHLQPDNRCGIYHTRPLICREYTTDNCEYDDDSVYDRYFETADQLQEYVEAVFPRDRGFMRSREPELLPVL